MHAMYEHGLIGPVVALVLWSLVMWIWLYATRIPAMQKAKIDPQSVKLAGSGRGMLPPNVEQVANNYNHLMEQPTIFYATCLAAQLAAQTDATNIGLAWTYVGLRILHSLIQATVNVVMVRFLVFTLSSIALAVLAVRLALSLWS